MHEVIVREVLMEVLVSEITKQGQYTSSPTKATVQLEQT